jgi:hypothetical protein
VRRSHEPRIEALLNMAQYYRSALDLQGGDDSHGLPNWAAACLLLQRLAPHLSRGDWSTGLETLVARQIERNAAKLAIEPDFWTAVSQADLSVVQLLLAADDVAACRQHGEDAAGRYREAMARGASPREAGSVREHLEFLVALVELTPEPGWPKGVPVALRELLGTL